MSSIRQSKEGFTIIEVLIVLAIAGIFLLVVLNALPAVRRNSRNNQRAHDVSLVLDQLSRYQLQNSGTLPAACGTGPAPSCGSSFLAPVADKLVYFDQADISYLPDSDPSVGMGPGSGNEQLHNANHRKCQLDTNDNESTTSSGAGYRDVVAFYKKEAGTGGYIPECLQL